MGRCIMRSYEFVSEQEVNEAISLSQHEHEISQAMEEVIPVALRKFRKKFYESYEHPEEQELYDNGSFTKFNKIIYPEFHEIMKKELIKELGIVGRKIVPALETIRFSEMKKSWGGYAQGFKIRVNEIDFDKLAEAIFYKLNEMVLNSYGEGEFLSGLWRTCIDPDIARFILTDKVTKVIGKISNTIIHELVHIQQNEKQIHRGGNYEFRSYLDKDKNEYLNLAMKKEKETSPADDDERYNELYMASPAEIAAHAHNITIKAVKDYDLNNPMDYNKNSYIENAKIALSNITGYLDDYLHNRYKGSQDKRTQMVYKRYHKMVYQELRSRIEKIIAADKFHDSVAASSVPD